MTIKHFLLNFFFLGGGVKMYGKMAISAYILKTVEKDPFSRLQMRAKEMFNRHQFSSWFTENSLRYNTFNPI